ncbi:hypothetical protein [Desulfonatronovibrio hydrogenovorans]|uniref:hypothetical protein n=1 Tax=Desulfonatronovibrio hydrogenovorans TaxID=53245 RepID=UPI00049057F4|nr:hypothetical protein [Desulfonatronovibrio hydrogenovorans]
MTQAKKKRLSGFGKLLVGMAMIWMVMFVVLPWAKTLPVIKPIMDIITEADLDANQYFYTQSEETYQAGSRIQFRLEQARK